MTILQLIIGFFVLVFAAVIFLKALFALVPALNIISLGKITPVGITGMSPFLELVLSIFIFQVVAVYTKNIYDKLNVSG